MNESFNKRAPLIPDEVYQKLSDTYSYAKQEIMNYGNSI